MFSLATVRVFCGRFELCPVGTGVTEKVTKTYHSFFGLSSLLLVTMTGSITCGLPWLGVVNILGEMNGSVSTSTWVVRVTLYFLGGNEWVRSHVTRCVDPLLPLLLSARGVERGAPLAAPGVSLATGRGRAKGSLPVC